MSSDGGAGSGGAPAASGGSGAGTGGAAASGGAPVASGGAPVASGGAPVASGGASGGGNASGGSTESGGAGSTSGGSTGSGGAGSGGMEGRGGGGSGVFMPSTGAPRTMGYVGCSMSVNVAEGYQALGGQRLWTPQGAYNGQVVQDWANTNDEVWNAFESQVSQNGVPADVWVMLCIFDNMVTLDEARTIVGNVRERAPDATIYITGQPLYDDPNSCFLAGNGGPDKTDMIAQQAGEDAELGVIYPGSLGPLAANQSSDGCHTNSAGSQELGEQFIEWFGK